MKNILPIIKTLPIQFKALMFVYIAIELAHAIYQQAPSVLVRLIIILLFLWGMLAGKRFAGYTLGILMAQFTLIGMGSIIVLYEQPGLMVVGILGVMMLGGITYYILFDKTVKSVYVKNLKSNDNK